MDELEKLIDRHGLTSVIDRVVDICHEKADHIQVNWQDRVLARAWTKCAVALERSSVKVGGYLL
jgi:hypothetical protein